MAFGWKEAKKGYICPICGTSDWCATRPATDGYGLEYLCKRYTDSRVTCPGGDTPGKDGNYYIFVGTSRSGHGKYRNAIDSKTAEENGFHIWRANGKADANAVYGSGRAEVELKPENINEVASDRMLDMFYRAFIAKFPLLDSHKEYLRKEMWSDELIASSNLSSLPVEDWKRGYQKRDGVTPACFQKYRATVCKEIIEELGAEPIGVPGFYQDISKKDGSKFWTFCSRSGMLFPLYNECGQIVRLRVKMDFLDANKEYKKNEKGLYFMGEDNKKRYVYPLKGVFREEFDGTIVQETDDKYRGKGKYRWVTSYSRLENKEKGTYTNRFLNGAECGNLCGVYQKDSDNFTVAIATEGEKKSIRGNAALHYPFICIPGVSSYEGLFTTRVGKNIVDKLKSRGCKYIAVAYDADKYHNLTVLNAEKALVKRIYKEGMTPILVNWDAEAGKGIDDAINAGTQLRFDSIEESKIEDFYGKIAMKYDLI